MAHDTAMLKTANMTRSLLKNRLAATALWLLATLLCGIFLWIIGDLCWRGWSALSFSFLLDSPKDAGRSGGIFPVIVSTILILSVCLCIVIPFGLCSALFLNNSSQRFRRLAAATRTFLDLLAGMPSIVFGLFGMVFFGKMLGLESSILCGAFTLACMVLPLFIRLSASAFAAVDAAQLHAAAALGLSRWTTLWRVQLPQALPGIATAAVLAVGRALAETAALLFTSGYVMRIPESLLDSGRALSVHIYDLAMNVPGGDANAAGTALVLVLLLLCINGLVAFVLRQKSRQVAT